MTASESDPNNQAKPADSGDMTPAPLPVVELHQHHVSKILDEVLEEPEPPIPGKRFKHPVLLDVALAIGLMVALFGFTVGLLRMYTAHMARDSITRGDYKSAIHLLKGTPMPGFFAIPGDDPQEMLNQAYYLDALQKYEQLNDVDGALAEMQNIQPGSHYFQLAQDLIEANTIPSQTSLQGGTSVTEEATAPEPAKKPIVPEEPQDGSP
jgi:hypothetical protein